MIHCRLKASSPCSTIGRTSRQVLSELKGPVSEFKLALMYICPKLIWWGQTFWLGAYFQLRAGMILLGLIHCSAVLWDRNQNHNANKKHNLFVSSLCSRTKTRWIGMDVIYAPSSTRALTILSSSYCWRGGLSAHHAGKNLGRRLPRIRKYLAELEENFKYHEKRPYRKEARDKFVELLKRTQNIEEQRSAQIKRQQEQLAKLLELKGKCEAKILKYSTTSYAKHEN